MKAKESKLRELENNKAKVTKAEKEDLSKAKSLENEISRQKAELAKMK